MCKFLVLNIIAAALEAVGGASPSFAQTAPVDAAAKPAAKPSAFVSLLGDVAAISSDAKEITLKPSTGTLTNVTLDSKTHFMKIAPGETDLKKATDIQFSEIGVGDRVLARVRKSENGTFSTANTVVVMSKSAIASQQERNQAEWQTRGVVGTVTLVNPATNEITLKMQGADAKQVVVEPAEKVNVRKYAPNSIKFSDAVPSTISAIKTGDTIRVLGTKNEDGSRLKPEEIVYGSFVRQAGTILAIDSAAGTVKMTDLATKTPVMVKVDASTAIRRLPAMLAARLASAQNGGRPGMPGGPVAGGAPQSANGMAGGGPASRPVRAPSGPGGEATGGPMGDASGARRMDPNRMLERLPALTLADLKAGDAVIVASSGMKDGVISAISLTAGVEALLTAPAAPGQAAGPSTTWNFEISIPQ